jgi:formate hydrogenlyase transcriptional activator
MGEPDDQHQAARFRLLLEINNAMATILDLQQLFPVISQKLRPIFQHDGGAIGLYFPERNTITGYVLDAPGGVDSVLQGTEWPIEGTPAGEAIVNRTTVILTKPDREKYFSPLAHRIFDQGIESGCIVPLRRGDRVLGVVSLFSKQLANFSPEKARLLEEIGGQIAIALENALAYAEIQALKNKLATEKLYLEDEIRTEHNFEELIGSSPNFQSVLKLVRTVAPTDSSVLIRGETGTGKELIARAIHALSARSDRALVKLNCSAIPTGLLESELFGHEKGAFTGAIVQRIGRFELAHKGTLFLDEIGDIPAELQPKLLRVLQEQEFERLGSTKTQKVDVRLIAATNCNLEEMVAEKKYRSDLYYRISGFPVLLPALRERRGDIPELARFFTQKYARRLKKRIEAISDEDMEAMAAYEWPGNVRELEHFIERAVIFTQGPRLEISKAELTPKTQIPTNTAEGTLEDAERRQILRALQETKWVIGGPKGAAIKLGIKRTTLISRMQKLGIHRS